MERYTKLAVVGSRDFDEYEYMCIQLLLFNMDDKDVIISGGARGADLLAERFAMQYSIPTEIFLPDWAKYGKKAGLIRNKEIISSADQVIAFWDGESNGTRSSINIAKKLKKPLKIVLLSHFREF